LIDILLVCFHLLSAATFTCTWCSF